MNNHDKILISILYKNPNRLNTKYLNKIKENKVPNIHEYIIKRYDDSFSIKETITRMRLHIDVHPKCPICGKYVNYTNNINIPFFRCCSLKCSRKDESYILNYKRTTLERYGVDNISKLDSIKKRKAKTCYIHYKTDNPQKCKEIKEKTQRTCLDRYGSTIVFNNPLIKEKSIKTCIKKYGVSNPAKSQEIKQKIKRTCLERYGVSSYLKTEQCKINSNSNSAITKMIDTKRKNHTFNTSKPEEELYLYIKEKFPLVKRQYKDSIRYPFACDFYIPELDLFLELNANWTHGKHSFSSTNANDLYIIECWKKKVEEGHLYYANAIKTWTIYDVKKRNKAKEENLNYKEVWTLEEGKEFIDSLTYTSSAFTS